MSERPISPEEVAEREALLASGQPLHSDEPIPDVVDGDDAAWWTGATEHQIAQAEAADRERAARRSELVDLATVESTAVESLWGGNRVARKKLTLWIGDPGIGKSYASLRMAADLSLVGRRTLLMQVEDGLSDTTKPRLNALGADSSFIRAFHRDETPVLDAEGLAKLEWHLADWRPEAVIVDPVTYFIGSKLDMHRANEVRGCLAVLARFAEKYDAGIVPIIHMNKGSQKALYRALGSIDFIAAVRSVLLFGGVEDEPDRGCAMFHIKCNYGSKEPPVGFDITDAGFAWRESTDLTLADIEGRKPGPKPVKRTEAREWLRAVLKAGPQDSADVKRLAEARGISAKTFKLVSEESWVVKERVEGSRSWVWSIHPVVAHTDRW